MLSASVDNILRDLHYSSYLTKAKLKTNCFTLYYLFKIFLNSQRAYFLVDFLQNRCLVLQIPLKKQITSVKQYVFLLTFLPFSFSKNVGYFVFESESSEHHSC